MRGTKQKELWARKVAWMLAHRELWETLNPNDTLYMTQRPRWRQIVAGLKEAGLVANTTSTIDVPVRKLIQAAIESGGQQRDASTNEVS